MKKVFPKYRGKQDLKDIFEALSKKNKDIINKFMIEVSTTTSESTQKKIFPKVVQIAYIVEKPLDSLKDDDITSFLGLLNNCDRAVSTKNDMKKVLKRFLKWSYEDYSKRFKGLKGQKWKCMSKGENRKLEKSDLLTPDEMKLIVNSVENLKIKTILILMQESANRPEELLKITWKDIDLNKQEIKLNSSKTGKTRNIPINESSAHIKRYKKECFALPPKGDDFVFPIYNDNSRSMKSNHLWDYLKRIERKLEFNKPLYPYLWRHSILSNMIKTLSPKVYEMYAGHSLETGMKIYAHLDNDDLRDELYKKVYDIEELTENQKEEFENLKKENAESTKRIDYLEKGFKDLFHKFEEFNDSKTIKKEDVPEIMHNWKKAQRSKK